MQYILALLIVLFFTPNSIAHAAEKRSAKQKKYELALCAIFQNEAPWLREWIEFHKLVGVEHFYLYNNLSTDDYMSILRPYIKSGEVELFDWPYRHGEEKNFNQIQTEAYMDAINRGKDNVKWMLFLDTDEYMFPVVEKTLTKFLKKYDSYPGVVVNWQMYGTSHVKSIPARKLMIETLTFKAPDNYSENIHVKSIVKPKYVKKFSNPHNAVYLPHMHQVNANKVAFDGPLSPQILIDKIRINHYWTRDEDFFYSRKVPRREAWNEGYKGIIRRLESMNQVEDKAIFRFVPELRKRMGFSG